MSLFDSLKKGAKVVGQAAVEQYKEDAKKLQKMKEDAEEYEERFSSLSDEELLRKVKNVSGAKKVACIRLLKARGYHPKSD